MKVIIVEDSDLLQKMLMKKLVEDNNNISIMQAFTCQEALELFSSFNPDTVILDIDLPDGSGIELLRKFKKDNSGVRVIMFTNYSAREFKRSCLKLGANLFIHKSNLNELIHAIRNYSN